MKSAITVIDQELIDDSKSTIKPGDEACDRAKISVGTLKELILMCEDLIEINAELTKREQKYKGAIKDLINDIRNSDSSRCNEVIDSHLFCGLNELLKGDSDE